jgi:golgin subfamily A protein 1
VYKLRAGQENCYLQLAAYISREKGTKKTVIKMSVIITALSEKPGKHISNMFTILKNKIKEEAGSDSTKLAPSIPPQKITHGRHSRQGSGSSSGSLSLYDVRQELVSSPSVLKQDSSEIKLVDGKMLNQKELKRIEKRDDEWRQTLQELEEDLTKKLEKKEEEWKNQMEEKQRDWTRSIEVLEKEKSALEKEKLNLEDALKVADEHKNKFTPYQEDIDQLQGFQTQEMAKIKYSLLVKEQELAEKEDDLKVASSQMESLKLEITRLRHYEELANLQVLVGDDNKVVKTRLIEAEKQLIEVETDYAHLSIALEDEKSSKAALHLELAQLRDALEAEQTHNADLSMSLDRERGEKDETLLRNDQMNQQVELAKQELREQEQESIELHKKITAMEKKLADKDKDIEKIKIDTEELSKRIQDFEIVGHDKQETANLEQELRNNISELEEQVVEKNRNIRILQYELRDMKKILRRQLRLPAQSVEGTGTTIAAAVLTPSSSTYIQHKQHQQTNHRMTTDDDEVNFKYLKHVLIKFLISGDSEAQHLTRAVATLLRFSPEEERLLRDTLEWKMSWFGTRPSLEFGQTAKTIAST